MTNTPLNPNRSFTPELLRHLDALDGSGDGILDLTRSDVQDALKAAGITDISSLDKWDGSRSRGKLNLMNIRNPTGAREGFSSRNTHFQNRTQSDTRAQVFATIVDARSEFAQNAIAETLADAGNWRDLSRSQYNSFFNDRGYDRQSNHLTRQLSRLKELRSESTNPQLTKTVDAYIEFLEHINQSHFSKPRNPRSAECRGTELLAKARIEASTLDDSYTRYGQHSWKAPKISKPCSMDLPPWPVSQKVAPARS